ncbi:hypothetical protein HPHPH27_1647 [Helicobacter pylori Hp H-27]|uniref:Uncharacterized protein n=1 Tax=Helicobacter pylori R038b TaxID=1145115 RepID=K2L5H1_HELPX|nr:hypothetical protein HPHPH27_1647 [Helicobacter pylori Hp H-27]EKE89889.1 hypothetical protein OUM_1196 [Helicobacter pylori R038b]
MLSVYANRRYGLICSFSFILFFVFFAYYNKKRSWFYPRPAFFLGCLKR